MKQYEGRIKTDYTVEELKQMEIEQQLRDEEFVKAVRIADKVLNVLGNKI